MGHRSIQRTRPFAGICLLLLVIAGCDRPPTRPVDTTPAPRIVSLSPALSQVLLDLGLGDHVVGRTPWAPDGLADAPVVGDLLRPDLERISAVRPDVILVQPALGGVDPGLAALAEGRGWPVAAWPLNRLEDLEVVLRELPPFLESVGGDAAPARTAIDDWRARRERVLVPAPELSGLGETVLLFGVDPPMAFGRATYVDDLLQRLGGRNALTREGYLDCSLEDLAVLAPDTVLVLASDPASAEAARNTLELGLGPAVGSMRLRAVSAPDLLVPGTRLLDGVERLRAALGEDGP